MKKLKQVKSFVLLLSIIGISISVFAEELIQIDKSKSCHWFKYKKRKKKKPTYLIDSDGDQLTDYFEKYSSITDINLPDSDENGINDADEDFDNDTLTNLEEQTNGMNPLLTAVKDSVYNFYLLEKTVREDAESGNTDNWSVLGRKKHKVIANVADPDNPDNRVIQIKKRRSVTCSLKNLDENNKKQPERTQFKIEWDMKFNRSFFIFVSCSTNKGKKVLYYSASKRNFLGRGRYVHHTLGPESKNNTWITIHRDLQQDLWDAQPNCKILSINKFYVRGQGFLDNIATLAYADLDHDLIPDSIEDEIGTDKNNISDALGDINNDGISNIDEFYAGTLDLIKDEDGDGLNDDWEMQYFGNLDQDANEDFDNDGLTNLEEMNLGLNPTDPDQDSDNLPDGFEIKNFDNLNETAEGDYDSDGIFNIMEYLLKTNPTLTAVSDINNILEFKLTSPSN